MTENQPYTQQVPKIYHILSSVLCPNDEVYRRPVAEASITIQYGILAGSNIMAYEYDWLSTKINRTALNKIEKFNWRPTSKYCKFRIGSELQLE